MKGSHWIIIGLAAVIVLMILLWPEQQEPDNQVWKDTIAKVTEQLKVAEAQNQPLKDSIKKINTEHREETSAFKTTIGRLMAKKSSQRPKVDSIIFDNPVLIEYVNTADSVIEVQTYRIETLEYQYNKLAINTEAITANFESQLELHRQKYEAQVNLSNEYRKENRKVKRANKLLKVVAVVGTVGGLLIGGQL